MNDYSNFKEQDGPKDERFKGLDALVVKTKAAEASVMKLASLLEQAQETLRDLVARQLPAMLDDMGLKEFVNSAGQKIEIKEVIEAGISEANRPVAFNWLEENGHGGLIKQDITVSFSKNQEGAAKELMSELTGKFAAVTQNKKVHPSTLKAWVREMLGEGKAIPLEPFGVFRRREAKITAVK